MKDHQVNYFNITLQSESWLHGLVNSPFLTTKEADLCGYRTFKERLFTRSHPELCKAFKTEFGTFGTPSDGIISPMSDPPMPCTRTILRQLFYAIPGILAYVKGPQEPAAICEPLAPSPSMPFITCDRYRFRNR
jgi:hypothetical protein